MSPIVAALIGTANGFALAESFGRIPANFRQGGDATKNTAVIASILIAIAVLLGGILGVLLWQATR
jgi:hypothetical protein